MWLPKEQRKLLTSSYKLSGKTRESFELPIYEAMKILGIKEDTEEKFDRALNAIVILKGRKLIDSELEEHIFRINLTLDGLDLGKKYSSKLSTFCLWFEEHKVILTIIGLILTLLIVIFAGMSAFRK